MVQAVGETGSSPRVRGSPSSDTDYTFGSGIIPAGAGLTAIPQSIQRVGWDHPRGCGAHPLPSKAAAPVAGSSPRVRGSLDQAIALYIVLGIIPAGAGLTGRVIVYGSAGRDHPRGCGAHGASGSVEVSVTGSSPRVRGSLRRDDDIHATAGIIPAGAGLTNGYSAS